MRVGSEAGQVFWQRYLAGIEAPTRLPLQLPPSSGPRTEPERSARRVSIDLQTLARLRSYAHQQRIKPETVFLGAAVILVGRYCDARDLVIGIAVPSHIPQRPSQSPTQAVRGILPLRTQLPPTATVAPWLRMVEANRLRLDTYGVGAAPADVQRWIRHWFDTLLFDTAFLPDPCDGAPAASSPHSMSISGSLKRGVALHYDPGRFRAEDVSRMGDHMHLVLRGLIDHPGDAVSQIRLLEPRVRRAILVAWNSTAKELPKQRAVHELFEEQANDNPARPALVLRDRSMTYAELNERANQLAHHLMSVGIRVEDRIGILIERSFEMIVAVLGVLKAGACYVPLDPLLPEKRVAYIVDDAAIKVLLTLREHRPVHSPRQPQVILLDDDWPFIASRPSSKVDSAVAPSNLAYIIYTSGSTGKPKGVAVQHQGALNLARAQRDAFPLGRADRVLQFASLSFDASVWEMCMAWSVGAALMLLPSEALFHPALLAREIASRAPTFATLPPSVLMALPEDAPSLRCVVSAGEACDAAISSRWSRGRRFFNAYGPTEATVCATMSEGSAGSVPPIGRPLDNVRVHVLDSHLEPVPPGIPGELYVGGVGLARGYVNLPRLTAERFIPDPFSEGGARLYQTGDLARYREGGVVEFLGRVDHQIKINGIRIEPGEVEEHLREHPNVRDAVVLQNSVDQRLPFLTAYVVPTSLHRPSAGELKGHLRRRVPGYMVPESITFVEELPHLPSGKVDRRALTAAKPPH